MPKILGVPYRRAVAAFRKAGFEVVHRGGKHTAMSNGEILITIPRHNPVDQFILAACARQAGLTIEEFRKLL
jgi:predicted RNA binding protein YcfA (HicA-like mRNA interferase family)